MPFQRPSRGNSRHGVCLILAVPNPGELMKKLLHLFLVLMALLVIPAAVTGCNFDDDDGEAELDT